MWSIFYQWASPPTFCKWATRLIPWCAFLCLLLISYGVIDGLLFAPPDYQQGDAYRIIYFHVPSAFLSLFIYVVMAVAAVFSLVWRVKLADIIVSASAPLGAWFTFLALVTGSLWGKPMWGTWWIWDARLTSELILLFLYLGFLALQSAIPDSRTAARAGNLLVLVGVVNIPIIHYSVYWWNTLHQGATLSRFAKPTMDASMLHPLLAMIGAFLFYYATLLLMRARSRVIWHERKSAWVKYM